MKKALISYLRYFTFLMIMNALSVNASVRESFDPTLIRLSGHVLDNSKDNAVFLKNLNSHELVPLTFTLPLRNQNELEELIQRLSDPSDLRYYGKYLSSEEFIERFAPTQEDYDKVVDYANSLGLTIINKHSNRTLLNVTGSTHSIETAFKLN